MHVSSTVDSVENDFELVSDQLIFRLVSEQLGQWNTISSVTVKQDYVYFLSQNQSFLAGTAAPGNTDSGIFSLKLTWHKWQTTTYSKLVAASRHPPETLWFSSIYMAGKESCCLDLRLVGVDDKR